MTQREDGEFVREEPRRRNGGGGSGFAGFLLGGLLGAGAMLLLAPQSGRQTREEVRQGALDLRDRTNTTVRSKVEEAKIKAQQLTADARQKAEELKEQGKDVAADQLDRAAAAAQNAKRAIRGS
jgi:gas vesicle protein